MAGNGACWVVHHQTALSDENKQRWRHNRCDLWWYFVWPQSNDPAHRVTLQMNETIAQHHHHHVKKNRRIKIETKRWWILVRRFSMWKICGKFKNQKYNVHLAWCFNQIWSYQLYKTAGGWFQNSDMILFTLNTSNGDQESSFTYLASAAIIRSSRLLRILRKLQYYSNPGVFNKRRI